MCGIVRFWQRSRFAPETAEGIANRMADTLVHRGPDDDGVWIDGEADIALGHRNWQYHLWDVLIFQAWLEAQQKGN